MVPANCHKDRIVKRFLELQHERKCGGNRGDWSLELRLVTISSTPAWVCVKIRSSKTENFPVITIPDGSAANRVGVAAPEFGEAERAASR
jgi:hypothetical protein